MITQGMSLFIASLFTLVLIVSACNENTEKIKSKKLKNAKKVYVRAKAVVTLGDDSIEGPWSKKKKVKIKK